MKTWPRYRPLWYIQISILYEPELTPAPGRYLGELWAVAIVLSASITTLVMPYWPWRGSGRAMMGLGVGRALVKLTARKHSHTRGRRQRHGHRHLTSEEPATTGPRYLPWGSRQRQAAGTSHRRSRNDMPLAPHIGGACNSRPRVLISGNRQRQAAGTSHRRPAKTDRSQHTLTVSLSLSILQSKGADNGRPQSPHRI